MAPVLFGLTGLTVNSGTFDYVGTGTITLGGDVSNTGGTVRINGGTRSGGTPDCGIAVPLLITSSSPAKTWTGNGNYLIADVKVVQQQVGSPPDSITVYGTLDQSKGSSGWESAADPCPTGVGANPTLVRLHGLSAVVADGGGVAGDVADGV